jgi:hypothetical protein
MTIRGPPAASAEAGRSAGASPGRIGNGGTIRRGRASPAAAVFAASRDPHAPADNVIAAVITQVSARRIFITSMLRRGA